MDYAYLRVKTGLSERPVDLSGIPLTIGRHENNRLVINDNMASRFHCVVERVGTEIKLRDLQSRNGTLLNGQRVMQASLKSGDVIAIGSIRMTLVVHSVQPGAGKAAGAPGEPLDELEVLDDLEVIEDAPLGAPLGEGETAFTRLRSIAENMLNKTFDLDQIQVFNIRGKALRDAPAPGAVPGAVTSDTDMLLRLTLLICFRSHATDIHLEPRSEDFLLRLRMDGNLLDMVPLDRDMGTRLTALVKVLCELDTTQRNIVQEGHFAARAPNASSGMGMANQGQFRRVDYRVSFVPTLHGQKLVVRVFDTANAPMLLQDLHLPDSIAEHVGRELTKDTGLILVCGPTGSGKTTTLYSLIRSCGSTFRNIVTIEDPVEVQIEGTTQLPVDEENGKGFAALLRSVLRQDPDVIMVGEIRDPETARIALQASMTGHLVLSTIHTRDTIGTVYRLLDLGIEPYMVAQGLQLVLAQRLVRTLCKGCRRPVALTPDDRRKLGVAGERVERIYAPVGCPKCLGTGFYSRRGFFEFLATSDKLREQIMTNPSLTEMQKMVGPEFVRLSDHGYQLVAEGATSIDEVERAIGR
jgi:type II secretory ATPase GspE/PulE/Tfp pilus assembly ATPase PilB-like protein